MLKMLFVLIALSCFSMVRGELVTATGRITCFHVSVPFVEVYLMDKDVIVDDGFASTRTDANGNFDVTGKASDVIGRPDPYIKVKYRYIGPLGQLDIVGNLKISTRSEKSAVRPYNRKIAFGVINFVSMHCKAYVEFYKAMVDFRIRAARPLPYPVLYVETGVFLAHGGSPYATTDTVRIPAPWLIVNMDFATARHELAHTVRHSFDGTLAHFLWDAGRFWYLRVHTCRTRSNFAYAFNEGWAEFWENACHGVYGASPKDYKIEGNVAKALRALKAKCRSTDAQMVNVLVANPGTIHSFLCYNIAHRKLYGCRL